MSLRYFSQLVGAERPTTGTAEIVPRLASPSSPISKPKGNAVQKASISPEKKVFLAENERIKALSISNEEKSPQALFPALNPGQSA